MKIKGRIIYVTGGCSGLGGASARDLVRRGAFVVVLDLNEEEGQKLELTFKECLKFYKVDVTSEEQVLDAMNKVTKAWPDKKVGGVVNCGGVSTAGRIVQNDGTPFPLEAFEHIIKVNLLGTYNVSRLVASQIVQAYPPPNKPHPLSTDQEVPDVVPDAVNEDRGCIVLVSSTSYVEGQAGQTPYAASKGGVAALALPMARDLARYGIRAVAIAPSLFVTSMASNTPPKAKAAMLAGTEFPPRFGYPDEFAHLVAACFENPMLNGSVIRLDGASRLGKL